MSKFSHRLGANGKRGKAKLFAHTSSAQEREREREMYARRVRFANGFNWNSLRYGAPQGKRIQRASERGGRGDRAMNVSLIIFTQCSPAVERIMEH